MKLTKKIYLFSIFAAIMLTPVFVYAGVYFIENDTGSAEAINTIKPCIIDYRLTSCEEGKVPQGFCPSDNRYFKSCGCDTNVYKYDASNCTNGKTLGGRTCGDKYETCACDAKYQYTTANCTGGKVLSGNSCDGKYEACGCTAEYSKTCASPMIGGETACDGKYKTCKCPASYTTCSYGEAGGATKCIEENGTVKWSNCKAATCESGGYFSSVPVNQTCTQITHNSLTCYKDCRAITCADGGFAASCPSEQTGTAVTYANLTCYKDCKILCDGYSKTTYCFSSDGMKKVTCPEDSTYSKCVFDCPTYKAYIESTKATLEEMARTSMNATCGRLCDIYPVWPTEFCNKSWNELTTKANDYYAKCGERITIFPKCAVSSCKDGMLGVDMCGVSEIW